ncbi:MAG: amino-acid N-acetyltransferase [Treponema sp.]|jgi:amino-acid N-acetyltransferase|nr:amino-acid N-acetyltransferase [Treponema sp.]
MNGTEPPMNLQMDLIREAFHYRSRFAGSTMVFKIDFPVTLDPAFPSLMKDLALLAQTGFRVAVVPGAKEWIDSVLEEYGVLSGYAPPDPDPPSAPAGTGRIPALGGEPLRITGERAMPFVEMAAFHVATRFMTALSANRCDSVIGNFVRARGLGVVGGRDMENTGRVHRILTGPMGKVLDLGMIPILPCIGWGPSGKPYNVPSGEIALAASAALGAVKLFIVSAGKVLKDLETPGDMETGEGGRIIRLTPKEAEAALNLNAPGGRAESLAALRLALDASKAGVERIHLIDGREEGAVLRELFSNLGSGTMVYADEYEAIRPLKTQDIPDILRIMEPLMRQGILLRRGPAEIQEKKEDYWVFGIDGRAHACGALHCWEDRQGEIAAVAVDSAYADMGLGSRMVRFLINRAAREGLRRVFALTTKTQDWFETLGFKEQDPASLPEGRKKIYSPERKSKIYVLELEGSG